MKRVINTFILAMAMLGLTSQANATTIVSLVTAESGTITDLDLWVNLSDNWAQDVDIMLKHGGTQVHVYDATDDCSDPFDVVFDDESGNGFAPRCGDVLGDYQPDNPLSAFDGMELAGTWELILWDDIVPGDNTDLLGWGIAGTIIGAVFEIAGPSAENVDTESIPEPATLALLGMGLLGFAAARRKQTK